MSVLVTGAGHGQGAAHAHRLAAEGARVTASDVDYDAARQVVEQIVAQGGEAIAVQLDVASGAAWTTAVDAALDAFGALDGLVNNAGVSAPSGVEDWDAASWDTATRINQTGVLLGMRAVAEPLRRSGRGAIVNIASLWAHTGGLNGSVGYVATKAAVLGMTKAAALELAPAGIRVNSVSPGYLEHLMHSSRGNPASDAIPLARLAAVDEVSGAVAFLLSKDASYVTGIDILVDGGASLG